jgi:hypothetical protein
MIAAALRFILSNYLLAFFVLGLLAALISIARKPTPRTRATILEALLAYYCLFSIGLFYLYNFVMHVFFADMAAKFIGWQNSPFQLEVGFASLGFGVVGLLAFRPRFGPDFGLRLAAIIGPAFFMWGAAGGHLYQMIVNKNFAPGNAGVMFYLDIIMPAIGIALLIAWRRAKTIPPPLRS